MKLLLLGATGLVGSRVLERALSNAAISEVIAPTRKPLEPAYGLVNPVVARLEDVIPLLETYQPDAMICALGTTQAKAGSKEAFRHVDCELPIRLSKAARLVGVEICAIVTAMGASARSPSFYYRTKAEVETKMLAIEFRSLTICRPSLIAGERNETRTAESAALKLLQFLAPILPRKFRVNPADKIAAALLDAVIAGRTGAHWVYADEMS